MAIDIGDLLVEGFERTVARNGLLFAAIFYVLSVVGAVLSAAAIRQPDAPGSPMRPAPALGISEGVAAALSLVLAIVSLVVTVGAIRTFVGEETRAIPTEHFTRNVLWAVGNLIVGGIVFGIVVAVGFVFLIVPGLFLLVSLFFWNYYVVVEDDSFVRGFRRSWEATGGHRLRLFALGVIVAVVGLVIGLLFAVPTAVLPRGAGLLFGQVGSAITQVFSIATASRAFVRLRDADREAPSDEPSRGRAVE